MPLIELLLLLPLLLRTALLYGRRRTHQRMRFLWKRSCLFRLRWTELAIRRLRIPILLRLGIPLLGLRVPVLRLRRSLLLICPRLRWRHLPHLMVAIRLSKRLESSWDCCCRAPGFCAGCAFPTGRTSVCSFSRPPRLRLPLIDWTRRSRRGPDCDDWTAKRRCRRPHLHRTSRPHHAAAGRLGAHYVTYRRSCQFTLIHSHHVSRPPVAHSQTCRAKQPSRHCSRAGLRT